MKELRIVALGGGTGLSTMLRGLKEYSRHLTAIVTVMDDGGGSGKLREDLRMLPPGDIRNCILALAETEPLMAQLLQYRFKEGTSLKGQSFGNLFIAAMNGICGNFEEAVRRVNEVLAVTGRVLPVTNSDAYLYAHLEDGNVISGESYISEMGQKNHGRIRSMGISPELPEPAEGVLDSIREADLIVMGPGSLYTSIIPNLLVKGVADEICASAAQKVYILNIMCQPGETEGYTAADHIEAIFQHGGDGLFDYCITNKAVIPDDILRHYAEQASAPVVMDYERLKELPVTLIERDLVHITKNRSVRHDTDRLARICVETGIYRSEIG